MARGAGRVKEEEFGFVWVDTKSNSGEPFATKRGKALELGDNPGKGFAGRKDAAIVYIKREVGVPRAPEAKLKKRGSKYRGKNRRERGALRGTANGSKRL